MVAQPSRDIHFLLFYSIWTLQTTPIQLVSILFIAAVLHCPYSSLKCLVFPYTCNFVAVTLLLFKLSKGTATMLSLCTYQFSYSAYPVAKTGFLCE